MCNLYRLQSGQSEIAKLFGVVAGAPANVAAEVYPGYPALVVAQGTVRAMHWGFPLVLTGKQGQKLKPKPVTNARSDKLHTPFWRDSFAARRCLIPVSAWAEPVGAARAMTRVWYGLEGEPTLAIAGLWRESAEWGAVHTMVMVPANTQMEPVHDRMPVILRREHWALWQAGSADQAFELCQTWPGELSIEHSAESWVGKPAQAVQPALL